jgi:hypothetical protein
MKHSLIHLILWLVVAVLFTLIFFSSGTIENWGDNRTKTLMLAALFFVGYGGDTVLRIIFRKRRIVKDERDDYINLKAMSASFILSLIYVFIVAISLYTYFEAQGYLPIAWVWFIAYSLIVVANICGSAFSIFYYWKNG